MDLLHSLKSLFHPRKDHQSVEGYTFANPYPQQFSIASNIIFYITKNPSSPKAWKKLIQTCKYFYSKNPVIAVDYFYFDNEHSWWSLTDYDYYHETWEGKVKNIVPFDFVNKNYKLWLHGFAFIEVSNCLPALLPKLYQNDIRTLLLGNEEILFNDLKLLASSDKLRSLILSAIMHENGDVVSVAKMIKTFSKLLHFKYTVPNNSTYIITPQTAQEILDLIPSTKLMCITLRDIPEEFNFQVIFDYIMDKPKIKFNLNFRSNLSENYKNLLKAGVEKILARKKVIFPPQSIEFHFHSYHDQLDELYNPFFFRRCIFLCKYYKWRWSVRNERRDY